MRSEEWWKGPTIHIGPQYPFYNEGNMQYTYYVTAASC